MTGLDPPAITTLSRGISRSSRSRRDCRPDLGGDAEDLRADQSPGHGGEAAPWVRTVQIELQLLHGVSSPGQDAPIYHSLVGTIATHAAQGAGLDRPPGTERSASA